MKHDTLYVRTRNTKTFRQTDGDKDRKEEAVTNKRYKNVRISRRQE